MKTAVLINRSVRAGAAQVQSRLATLANLAACTEIHATAASLASHLKIPTQSCTHIYIAPESTRGVRCKVTQSICPLCSFLLPPAVDKLMYISCYNSSHSELGSVCRSQKSVYYSPFPLTSPFQGKRFTTHPASGKVRKQTGRGREGNCPHFYWPCLQSHCL